MTHRLVPQSIIAHPCASLHIFVCRDDKHSPVSLGLHRMIWLNQRCPSHAIQGYHSCASSVASFFGFLRARCLTTQYLANAFRQMKQTLAACSLSCASFTLPMVTLSSSWARRHGAASAADQAMVQHTRLPFPRPRHLVRRNKHTRPLRATVPPES